MKKGKLLAGFMSVIMLGTLLSGCGGTGDSGASGEEQNNTEQEATGQSLEELRGTTLNVMTWGAYIDWAIPEFEETYGIKVNLDYYNSEQEAINKLKAGRIGSVDVLFLGSGHEMQAFNQELIVPIDVEQLKNFDELYPFFQEHARDEENGPIYKIPFAWGTNSFMYNADLITEDIDSWEAMYDPQYAGKISLVDRAELIYWYTCLALGKEMNDASEETFEAVRAKAEEQMKLNKTLWSSGDDIVQYMMNDEIWLAHAYDGLALRLQQQGKNIKYVIPKEGAQGWFDNLCLVNEAPNPDGAMLFIDFMISKEIQKGVAENVAYAITNQAAADELDPQLRTDIGMEDVENRLSELKFCEFMGVDWNTEVNQMWTEIKAGSGVS